MPRPAPPPTPSTAARSPSVPWAALLALALAGLAARVAAARGDLWLDEIWSIRLAQVAGSAAGVLTTLHHDNNHYLNTWWLQLTGEAPPLVARGLALASGAACLVALGVAGARRNVASALLAATLGAGSQLLFHYQSEARGYGPASLFVVVAALAEERWLGRGGRRWALLLGASLALGLLAHLTIVFLLAGTIAWWAAEAIRRRRIEWSALLAFCPPVATLAVLWTLDLRHLVRGGGPLDASWPVLREFWRLTFNLPGGVAEWLGLAVLALVGWRLVTLARRGETRWVLFAGTFAAALAPLLLRDRSSFLAARYLLVCAPLLLLLAAEGLAELAAVGRAGQLAAAGAVILFLAGAVGPWTRLASYGRGQYREAIAYLEAVTPGPEVLVAGDHDFRNSAVLEYHAAHQPLPKPLVWLGEGGAGPAPEWYFVHAFDPEVVPAASLAGPGGASYRLERVFPHGGLSGWSWILYRRAGP